MDLRPDKILAVNGHELGIIEDSVFLTPDTITDTQIAGFWPAVVAGFEDHCELLRAAIRDEAIAVAEEDLNKLRMVAGRAKSFAAQLSRWNDRLGDVSTPRLREIERGFAADADYIRGVIDDSVREEREPSDWWRHAEGAPDQ